MSAVWRYFTAENNSSLTAKCNVCKANVSRGGQNKASFNTTNLIRHLKRHSEQYAEYCGATEAKVLKQPTLLATVSKLSHGSEKYRGITERIAAFIALDDQPLSVVDNGGFRDLMEYIEPRYDIPSRHYMCDTAIPALHKKVRE